jgi:disulfide bond formation protein DsbB
MERTLSLPVESSPRLPLLVVASGVIALGTAFTAQYWGGLQPCVLCVYQRWPYGIAIALGLAALVVQGRARGWLLTLAGLTFLAGGGIAIFHVGVEQGWWEGTTQCGSSFKADSLEALRAQIMAAPLVRCTDIAWSFAGISMAGFNVIASAILALVTLAGARRLIRDAS